jgi:triphosphatase
MSELELKFALPLGLQDRLAQPETPVTVERVWSCYYDTPDGALTRARMAVRVRLHGDRWVQTVKADSGDRFERFEWERPIAGPTPERTALPPEDTAQGAIAHRSFGQWRALFETDFERRSHRLTVDDRLEVEIAQDVGEIRCGERREPIREVELERIRGSRPEFFEWALHWARTHQACLLMPTKNERGLRLAARLPAAPAPERATPAMPNLETDVGPAAAQVIRACIAHACANIDPMLAADHPEGPHQFRVALRRLRAAIRLFDLRARSDDWIDVDREASVLADVAGRVRDLDVFEEGALAELRVHFPSDAALEALARAVVDGRESARHALRRMLTSPPLTLFVLRALALAEGLAVASPSSQTDPVAAVEQASEASDPTADPVASDAVSPDDEPAAQAAGGGSAPGGVAGSTGLPTAAPRFGPFARSRLEALLARVRRRARRARIEEDWHRVRLAVKTLRYALEFSAQTLPRQSDRERAQTVLARWQNRLGEGQDLAVARDIAGDVLGRPDVPPEAAVRAIALIDGWRAFAGSGPVDHRPNARRALRALEQAIGSRPPMRRRESTSRS